MLFISVSVATVQLRMAQFTLVYTMIYTSEECILVQLLVHHSYKNVDRGCCLPGGDDTSE